MTKSEFPAILIGSLKPDEEGTIFINDTQIKYAKPYALKTILDSLQVKCCPISILDLSCCLNREELLLRANTTGSPLL